MQFQKLDHIVLSCQDLNATLEFYSDVLGMKLREERPGKWSAVFGDAKISFQDNGAKPEIAKNTKPGSGNFCLLTETPIDAIATELKGKGISPVSEIGPRDGAQGPIVSFHFRDPEDNLIEIGNPVEP